jgi:hypothetical protein
MVKDFNGREQIRCTSVGCKFDVETFVEKADGEDINVDVDLDNHQYKSDGEECDICGISKAEHKYKEFDKPEEVEKLDSKTIVNRSAESRAETVGESTGSPKETNDVVNSIPKVPTAQVKSIPLQRLNKDHIPSTPKDDGYLQEARNKQDKINGKEITKDQPIGDINAKGEFPLKPRQSPNTMTDSNGNVNKLKSPSSLSGSNIQSKIEGNMVNETSQKRVEDISKVATPVELIMKFGVSIVKEALEEAETIQYLKTLHKKYQK